ncbi:uncharacterized protein LOC106404128 [Brassica napus]|uniref:uncharacterized protein LOC106404128 n=1 Tax=Brassica napus TaxID=3708 RepID=UPI0006AA71CF|nr:uncharacterized protein LOC106404128 [Brassica napus]
MELTSSFEDLRRMAFEDFGIDQNLIGLELGYLSMELISSIDCPPVIIESDRQIKKFLTYVRGKASTRLCVYTSPISGNNNNIGVDNEKYNSPFREQGEHTSFPPRDDTVSSSESSKDVEDNCNSNSYEEDDVLAISAKEDDSGKSVMFSLMDAVKRGQTFQNKTMLKAALEMSAKKHNFDYKVVKSDKKLWYIRCIDNHCKWSVRAEGLSGSTYLIIKKYVVDHTCAASNINNGGRTASAKTVGGLIMHRYDGVKEGPKTNDVIHIMRMEHGCEISKSLAWGAREFAIGMVRGIPEKSFGKIQIRGFQTAMRQFLVVDGTFLKSKYKGVLLAATALDGNSNLYLVAFAVVDSENDRSWDWFMRQLKVVVADENSLAFVLDKNASLCKRKGTGWLIAKASKAYRVIDFQKRFQAVCNISPAIGKYLTDADVTKWACYQFPGFRHAIKTGLTVGRAPSSLTDDMYTTSTWRTAYQETINPIGVPEDSWVVPDDVRNANVVPP